ncbi:MAG: EI24 domain-containing protein [Bdellovibrionales bacterium]
MIADFRGGLAFYWRGWQYIATHRSLMALALFPFFLSLASVALFFWLLWSYLPLWIQSLISGVLGLASGFWYDLLYYPMIIGGGVLAFVALLYVTYVLHTLIAVPFYSALAERTRIQLGKKENISLGFGRWLAMTARMMWVSVVKALLLLGAGLILFLCSFIPVLNILAALGALLILAFDCMDYTFEVHGMDLRARLDYLFRERAQWAGMAAGLGLTLLIPGLTLLAIPGAVVGGALIMKNET